MQMPPLPPDLYTNALLPPGLNPNAPPSCLLFPSWLHSVWSLLSLTFWVLWFTYSLITASVYCIKVLRGQLTSSDPLCVWKFTSEECAKYPRIRSCSCLDISIYHPFMRKSELDILRSRHCQISYQERINLQYGTTFILSESGVKIFSRYDLMPYFEIHTRHISGARYHMILPKWLNSYMLKSRKRYTWGIHGRKLSDMTNVSRIFQDMIQIWSKLL